MNGSINGHFNLFPCIGMNKANTGLSIARTMQISVPPYTSDGANPIISLSPIPASINMLNVSFVPYTVGLMNVSVDTPMDESMCMSVSMFGTEPMSENEVMLSATFAPILIDGLSDVSIDSAIDAFTDTGSPGDKNVSIDTPINGATDTEVDVVFDSQVPTATVGGFVVKGQ